jgi:hypothetical protein
MARRPKLPKSLTTDLRPAGVHPFIVTSGGMERTRFRNLKAQRNHVKQYVLLEGIGDATPEIVEETAQVAGLSDLSIPEERAIHALQILLHDYGLNQTEGRQILEIHVREFLAAYGLSSNKGKGARDALDALTQGLGKERKVFIQKKGSKKVLRIAGAIAATTRISVHDGMGAADIDDPYPSNMKLHIQTSLLFTVGIHVFRVHKPRAFYTELDAHYKGRRRPHCVDTFLHWQLQVSGEEVTILQSTLIERIGLLPKWEQRKRGQVYKDIEEAIQVGLSLGYLVSFVKDDGIDPKYTFVRDPEKVPMARDSGPRPMRGKSPDSLPGGSR